VSDEPKEKVSDMLDRAKVDLKCFIHYSKPIEAGCVIQVQLFYNGKERSYILILMVGPK
jgi:hypothetical protein